MKNTIVLGDNLDFLRSLPDGSVSLIYIDPPFNTGKTRKLTRLKTVRADLGDRTGFEGKRYATKKVGCTEYSDSFEDYLEFIEPRVREARRILAAEGSFFFHIDYREVHYCKVMIDGVFGRSSFINEIIWSYDYGARSRSRWSPKHDNILWYAKNPEEYVFNYDEIDRIPYMAPGLVGEEKAARGKTPTDVWWHTIVPTNGKERTGYATQKPLGILERIVKVHSRPDDLVMDFFAGSGSFGDAAGRTGRRFLLVDRNPDAVRIMARRLSRFQPEIRECGVAIGIAKEIELSRRDVENSPLFAYAMETNGDDRRDRIEE